jgi:hypothetical protein
MRGEMKWPTLGEGVGVWQDGAPIAPIASQDTTMSVPWQIWLTAAAVYLRKGVEHRQAGRLRAAQWCERAAVRCLLRANCFFKR